MFTSLLDPRAICTIHASVVYMPTFLRANMQKHANFLFLRANVPEACQYFNLACQPAKCMPMFQLVCQSPECVPMFKLGMSCAKKDATFLTFNYFSKESENDA